MKNKQSKKHHYLPRHYLEGFTDKNGSFFVYDKKEDRIFQTNPDSFFFENNLNTVELPNGDTSDFLEQQYTDIENKCWNSIDKIRNSNSKTPIDFKDRQFLFFYLLFQYWRLPSNIDVVNKISVTAFNKNSSLDYLKIRNKKGDEVPKHVIDGIRHSSGFKKSMKIVLPLAPFFKDNTWNKKIMDWKFLYAQDKKLYFVGDKPIIINNVQDKKPENFLDEFIFPVSGNIMVVNLNLHISKELPPDFIVQYNTAVILKSERFVLSSDELFLKKIVGHYNLYVNSGKIESIIPDMFKLFK